MQRQREAIAMRPHEYSLEGEMDENPETEADWERDLERDADDECEQRGRGQVHHCCQASNEGEANPLSEQPGPRGEQRQWADHRVAHHRDSVAEQVTADPSRQVRLVSPRAATCRCLQLRVAKHTSAAHNRCGEDIALSVSDHWIFTQTQDYPAWPMIGYRSGATGLGAQS